MERDADEQERRAIPLIEAINAGADVGAETLVLSNEFTRRHTDCVKAWVKRRFRRAEGDSVTLADSGPCSPCAWPACASG